MKRRSSSNNTDSPIDVREDTSSHSPTSSPSSNSSYGSSPSLVIRSYKRPQHTPEKHQLSNTRDEDDSLLGGSDLSTQLPTLPDLPPLPNHLRCSDNQSSVLVFRGDPLHVNIVNRTRRDITFPIRAIPHPASLDGDRDKIEFIYNLIDVTIPPPPLRKKNIPHLLVLVTK